MAREQRRLAAVVAVDVVGYSRLMGRDESGTLARLREHRKLRFEPALTRYGGRLVKLSGDGALVEFSSAVGALSAAIEFQQAMVEANRDQPADTALVFRMGLHVGDLIVDGDDLYGDGVNIAARLETEAPPGGIIASRAVRDAVEGRLKAKLHALGELALKNIERPIRAFRVEWDEADWQGAATSPAKHFETDASTFALTDRPSIVVLPFQNMSSEPDQDYFADGMVEEITTTLSRLQELFVVSRNSAFTYKGKAVDVKQVGRELGVRYVLEGSVRKVGNRVRITTQLIDSASGGHLWADKFDGTLEDIFELHDRVAMDVASAVEPSLREAEIDRSWRKPTESLDAYDLYLRARSAFRDSSVEKLHAAFGLAQRALERDPHFSRALALQAECLLHLCTAGALSPEEVVPRGLLLAEAALSRAGDDSEALGLAAVALAYMGGNIETALSASHRAVTLSPNGTGTLDNYGQVQLLAGNPRAAIESFSRALQLSPRDPYRGYAEMGLSVAYRQIGHPSEALIWGRRAILSLPMFAAGYRAAAAAMVDLGRIEEARELIGQLLKMHPKASIRLEWTRRGFRNREAAESWIAALRLAGLPIEEWDTSAKECCFLSQLQIYYCLLNCRGTPTIFHSHSGNIIGPRAA